MPDIAAFLKQTGTWRMSLARLLVSTGQIGRQCLNEAINRVLDDLLFLRSCELLNLLLDGSVRDCAAEGGTVTELARLRDRVHHRWGFEHLASCQQPGGAPVDELPVVLRLADPPLSTIIDSLYDARHSRALRRCGGELLGHVYEQGIANAVQVDPNRDRIVTMPARERRHSGTYYTPGYIVRYIVDRCLAKLTEDGRRDPEELRILDPSCGGGAFLVTVHQRLLERHRAACMQHMTMQRDRRLRQTTRGDWALTFDERRRFLLSGIYGVDLDPRAVWVTRRTLLMKLFEDEQAFVAEDDRVPLDAEDAAILCRNVCCGDSLLGPDPIRSSDLAPATVSESAVDFKAAFADVFGRANPGFDVILGNPPYLNVRLLSQNVSRATRRYLSERYRCASGLYDAYVLFVERAYELLRDGGHFGMILPNKFATAEYARICRELLQQKTTIEEITDVSAMRVFGATGVYPYLLFWRKQAPVTAHQIDVVVARNAAELHPEQKCDRLAQRELSADEGFAVHGYLSVEQRVPTRPLGDLSRLHSGTTGFSARRTAEALIEAAAADPERDLRGTASRALQRGDSPRHAGAVAEHFDFIVSRNIDRYRISLGNVRFQHASYVRPVLPGGLAWLSENKRQLYSGPKLVIAGMTRRLEVAWDPGGLALGVQVYAAAELQEDFRYLLGILNSALISFLFRQRFAAKRLAGDYLAINKGQLARVPIRVFDQPPGFHDSRRARLIELVQQRLQSTDVRPPADGPPDAQAWTRDLALLDQQIDDVVFDLYDVTEVERELITA